MKVFNKLMQLTLSNWLFVRLCYLHMYFDLFRFVQVNIFNPDVLCNVNKSFRAIRPLFVHPYIECCDGSGTSTRFNFNPIESRWKSK